MRASVKNRRHDPPVLHHARRSSLTGRRAGAGVDRVVDLAIAPLAEQPAEPYEPNT